MPTYTFIIDYLGGTYISQVSAKSAEKAMRLGFENLDPLRIDGLGPRMKELLLEDLDEPTPMNNVQNVWCSTTYARGKLAILTLVQTEILKT